MIISSSLATQKSPLTDQRSESSIKPTNSDDKTNKRSADFFDGCITIDDDDDDDDIQEIERQQ